MNSHEKNKMSMFNAVEAVINKYKEIVDAIPPLAEAITKFRQSMAEIFKRNDEYLGVTEGAVAAKNNSLDDLVERAFRLGTALYALGRKTDNEQFKSAGDMSITDITHMREPDIEQYCSKIAVLARASATELADFKVTAEEMDAFDKALDTYQQLVDSKDAKAAESKAARKALYECFDKTDEILTEDIDTIVELAKISNPDFYEQYQAARTIRDLGGHYSKNGKPAETHETVTAAVT